MAAYNPDFWEIATDFTTLDRVPAQSGLWFETEIDRERRYAMREFYEAVKPAVHEIITSELTDRQREIIQLYYVHGKTQEDIAAILNLSQSTVSRHLFGTARQGKKVGGAIRKLQKAIDRTGRPEIQRALDSLQEQLAEAV